MCSAVWKESAMTFQHKEQITNNKHHFLRNNWIASPLKDFSFQTVKWRWHDILSFSGMPPSHHRQCLAVSVLTAALICRPDMVFKIASAVLSISEKIRDEAPTTWPCCFIADGSFTARVKEYCWTHDIESHGGWNAPEMARIKQTNEKKKSHSTISHLSHEDYQGNVQPRSFTLWYFSVSVGGCVEVFVFMR